MYNVYRDYTEDGIIGLNGKQFLLDDNGEELQFTTVKLAHRFLEDNGVDIYKDELMHIVEEGDEEYLCVVDHE